ncbi:high affinity cAMP-specific and IBMX-insensitive 3',5'-cyclic phosphodiesterase 8-like [Drosophila tropicalis]|uniref:high affinity cAMP-specific and IBMX-insensitive 3',5'-cyclic phosphodiesterase 8-like n=1 Tax=Drosophila tropicalis TaxID=46794 RepID=UPI0035ABE2BE
MGCSPSTLPTSSSSTTAPAPGAPPLSIDATEKDGSRLFCIKLRRSRLRRCSCGAVTLTQNGDGNGSTAGSAICGDNLCNQVLLNPLQTKNEADYEKLSTGKKDSIVTVAALGNFTHSVVRRATGSTGTSGTSSSGGGNSRPGGGHRKSSLALVLTPEDEPMDVYQRNLMDLKYPTVLPPNPQLKALLVFHKADSICEVVTSACQRHQLDVTLVKSKEEALDTLQKSYATAQCYHLIIIDARSTKNLDAEHIARTIRHTHGHHLTTIIAVCKKSFFEKDDVLIALLDAGVNRVS